MTNLTIENYHLTFNNERFNWWNPGIGISIPQYKKVTCANLD